MDAITYEREQRQKVIEQNLARARAEAEMLQSVLDNPKNKKSGLLPGTNERHPMYWFANRRAEIKRKWGV